MKTAVDAGQAREVRIAPNIYQRFGIDGRHTGWRVFLRTPHPETGRSTLRPVRFGPQTTLDELLHFRDAHKVEAKHERRRRVRQAAAAEPGFATDARRYLQLETVRAMPSYAARTSQIAIWTKVFGDTPRRTITAPRIDEELQRLLNEGYSGSYVNKLRSALMSVWTKLDGRSAANPVKDTQLFDEAELTPRGQSYELLQLILDEIAPERGRGVKGEKGSRSRGSESRVRLEVLAWTGMDPSQLARMTAADVNLAERWYVTRRKKGAKRRRTLRPVIRKAMSEQAARAFKTLIARGLLGKPFSTDSLRHVWERAIARLQARLRKEYRDPAFTLPHVRLKDIRHSFGTKLYEQVSKSRGDRAALEIVGLMLDHAPGSPMTLRYSLGAVAPVLKTHMRRFGRPARAATARSRRQVLQRRVTGRGKR